MEVFLECDLERQSPLSILFREKIIFDFFQKGNIIFVSFIHIYRKYHLSNFFFRKIIFLILPKEKTYFLLKRYHLSRQYKKDHIPAWSFLERPSFWGIWRKHHISMYSLEKDYILFSVKRLRWYFWEKEISFFQVIKQERSYSSGIFFWKVHLFRISEENIIFPCIF